MPTNTSSANQIRRPQEIEKARSFLLDKNQSALLVLYGDRYEGRTGLLRALKSALEKPPLLASLIRWNSKEPNRYLDRGIAVAAARKLAHANVDVWKRYLDFVQDGQPLATSGRKLARSRAIEHYQRNLEKYFGSVRGQCLLDESLPPNLIPKLAELTTDRWAYLVSEIFDAQDTICVLVDDLDLELASPQSQVLREFVQRETFPIPVKLVVSVSAESLPKFSSCYNSFLRSRKIPVDALRIDPIRVNTSRPGSVRQAPFPPVIPGVVAPDLAKELSGDELFQIVARHDYYSQVHAAQIMGNGRLDVLAAGLVWVFGRVSDHDLVQVADHLKVSAKELRGSFEANYFLHNIRGSWEFIDGWREYLAVRRQVSDFVDSVEELFCVLALEQFRQTVKQSPLPELPGDRGSYLSPELTGIFTRFLDSIRELAKSGARKLQRKSFVHAASLFQILEELGTSHSSMWLPLTGELFDRTQSLAMLDFTLSTVEKGHGMLTQEERNAFLLAAQNALRWNDITLARSVIEVLTKRPSLAWNDNELRMLIKLRIEVMGVGQLQDLVDFTARLLANTLEPKRETVSAIAETLEAHGVPIATINNMDAIRSQLGTLADAEPKNGRKTIPRPKIGIITALPMELAAMRVFLVRPRRPKIKRSGGMKECYIGSMADRDRGKHRVVLCLAGMGNNQAAARATNLLRDFPSIRTILMVGIAGGIPQPESPRNHVRLGDIVVSGEQGIIQYDHVKDTEGKLEPRHSPRPPSASFLEAAHLLESEMMTGKDPILPHIEKAAKVLGWRRPPPSSDLLFSSLDSSVEITHPEDPDRKAGKPRIFFSPIASANVLLKNPRRREEIRDRFGVRAVEMESSGIADSTWNLEATYFVIRGICDYCDTKKNDIWQRYAAVVAAAFARTLLGSMIAL